MPVVEQMNFIVGDNSVHDMYLGEAPEFGKSIHYCNLKINGVSLLDFGHKIHPHLHFVGMASVIQKEPGPISGQIYRQLEEI